MEKLKIINEKGSIDKRIFITVVVLSIILICFFDMSTSIGRLFGAIMIVLIGFVIGAQYQYDCDHDK